ncbi:hypothetical protein D3C71_1007790 [compost metagenome]
MHDQACVCGLHRTADPNEQLQALGKIERTVAAGAVQWLAVHVLHHQIGLAGRGAATVVQPGDVGVLQPGQHLPLGGQALADFGRRQAAKQLDRHPLLVGLVGALGEEHRPHAATGHAPGEPPRTDPFTHLHIRLGKLDNQLAQRALRAVQRHGLRFQQLDHLIQQGRIVGHPPQLGAPLRRRQFARRIEHRAQLLPSVIRHCPIPLSR